MKQFVVIGNPIGHSLSPYLHNFVYNSLGIDAVYERKRVLKSELPQIINLIKNGDLSGINVTIPHKENIMEYLDNINPRAQSIGAVNIITNNGNKLIGNNTDWFGYWYLPSWLCCDGIFLCGYWIFGRCNRYRHHGCWISLSKYE